MYCAGIHLGIHLLSILIPTVLSRFYGLIRRYDCLKYLCTGTSTSLSCRLTNMNGLVALLINNEFLLTIKSQGVPVSVLVIFQYFGIGKSFSEIP